VELRHLRYFVAVAEELHFGKAAQRMHVVQPALSQQIQRLERELGVRLLARTKRRVSLTEPGRVFLEEARRTLAGARKAIDAARGAAAGESGRLRVGYVDGAIYMSLPEILRSYRERYPGVSLQITELEREEQLEAFDRDELDVGFFAYREGEGDFGHEGVAAHPLVVVLPDTHAAAGRKRVRLETLSEDPWVLFPDRFRSRYLELVHEACATAGFRPRVVQEAGKMNTLAALVGAGLGVTLLPSELARRPRAGVVVRRLAGRAPVLPLDLVWRTRELAPTAVQFLAVVREVRDRRPDVV
jgi:DNA-binding transcriptional LysR family regulator